VKKEVLVRHDPDGIRIIADWRHGTAAVWLKPVGGKKFDLHVYYPHRARWGYTVFPAISVDLNMSVDKLSASLEHLVESRVCVQRIYTLE
jgi:hypothetical protein